MTGKLFVIEGLDGSGKQTQSNMLYSRLSDDGYDVMQISYPRYEKDSSSLVKMYLAGDFGKDPSEVSPYISSTFFAADRYASYKTEYEHFYQSGGIVIADRYVSSNMVHQAGKIENKEDREIFLDWLWDFEFNLYMIPVPKKVFFLDIPPSYAMNLIQKRNNEMHIENSADIHEGSESHLIKSYENALELVKKYSWKRITCVRDDIIMGKELINEMLYNALLEYL